MGMALGAGLEWGSRPTGGTSRAGQRAGGELLSSCCCHREFVGLPAGVLPWGRDMNLS